MNVILTVELEQLVSRKVESGRYDSAIEVVREALLLLAAHDEAETKRRDEVSRKITAGIASLDRGEGTDADDVFTELMAGLDRLKR